MLDNQEIGQWFLSRFILPLLVLVFLSECWLVCFYNKKQPFWVFNENRIKVMMPMFKTSVSFWHNLLDTNVNCLKRQMDRIYFTIHTTEVQHIAMRWIIFGLIGKISCYETVIRAINREGKRKIRDKTYSGWS